MTKRQLLEPIVKDGLRATNFFNDRLLTAEALVTERNAYRDRDALLGQAVGDGVVYGLWISRSQADPQRRTLLIDPGLAVSRAGHPLRLPAGVELAVSAQAPEIPAGAGAFADCEAVPTGTGHFGSGLHLLTMCPAEGFEGEAPFGGIGEGSGARGCGKRYVVEGVRFRLVYLSPDLFGADKMTISGLLNETDAASRSLLRNVVAHACFGSPDLLSLGGDVYGWTRDGRELDDFGVLAGLRGEDGPLRRTDVPLAVIHWDGAGVAMVDNWSARRTVLPGRRQSGWAAVQRSRQEALREAVVLQFQEHVAALAAEPEAGDIGFADAFRFLPPVGAVPQGGGFSLDGLWAGLQRTPVLEIPAQRWRALLDIAMTQEPVQVDDGETFSLYQDLDNLSLPTARPRFIWFASAAVACRFCVPLRFVAGNKTITGEFLRNLFGATADGYAVVQNYALAQSHLIERQSTTPVAFMALYLAAGQVASLARVLDVLAGDTCCYGHDKAVDAFAGLWDAQGDVLVRVNELKKWINAVPDTTGGGNNGDGPAIDGISGAFVNTVTGEAISRFMARDNRAAELATILGEETPIFNVAANVTLWGGDAPETLGTVLGQLANDLQQMKSPLASRDVAALAQRQEAINKRWADFLKTQLGTE